MARPAKLTDKEWAKIEKRVPPLGLESMRSVAKELGVSEGVIRRRVKTHTKPVNELANQMATVETAFERLSLTTQVKVRTLADRLKGISEYLTEAGELGAKTASKLSEMANAKVSSIIEAASFEDNADALKSVLALTRGANDASIIGLGLLSANKEVSKRLMDDGENGRIIEFVNAPPK